MEEVGSELADGGVHRIINLEDSASFSSALQGLSAAGPVRAITERSPALSRFPETCEPTMRARQKTAKWMGTSEAKIAAFAPCTAPATCKLDNVSTCF